MRYTPCALECSCLCPGPCPPPPLPPSQVSYPLELDVYEFCGPELKQQLDPARTRYKELQDRLVEERKTNKVGVGGLCVCVGGGSLAVVSYP